MKIENLDQLLSEARKKEKKKIAVVAAEDYETLIVIERALAEQLAEFILIGDGPMIKEIIETHQMHIEAEIYDEADHKKAADLAVDLVVSGKAGALMKGLLHSNVFLKAILNKEKGLNQGRHITQISITENLNNDGLLMITDCAISVAPDTMGKKEIVENAVALAHQLGIEVPKVGILAPVENINLAMQDTIDAAILSKMSERGQIKGCIIDGPFAFDNVISKEAAAHKGIKSPVAGVADIVLVPNLLVGNALTKSLTYMAKKQVVAATVGAAVPIVFTSRTESIEGKLLSIALATYTA